MCYDTGMESPQKPKGALNMPKIPGVKKTRGSLRKNLYNIEQTSRRWAEANADTFTTRILTPEELAELRAHQKVDRNPIT